MSPHEAFWDPLLRKPDTFFESDLRKDFVFLVDAVSLVSSVLATASETATVSGFSTMYAGLRSRNGATTAPFTANTASGRTPTSAPSAVDLYLPLVLGNVNVLVSSSASAISASYT